MSSIPTTAAQVPERMTEEEARKFIDTNTPRHNKVRETLVAIKTRADEGRRQIAELLDLAEKKLGTRDESEVARILEDRLVKNGTKAKAWIQGVEACEAELDTISRAAAPGR